VPNLRCPKCYYATSVSKDAILGVTCATCGENLFDYYYEGKTEDESKAFIEEMNRIIKKKKGRADRERRQNETSHQTYHQPLPSSTDKKSSFVEYIIAAAVIFGIYASVQYFQMRSDIQETAINILNDNGYSGYEADGINLPLGIVIDGNVDAKIFLKSASGDAKITEWQITSKGIPLLSVFTGYEYWVEISGLELMKLQN